MKCPECGAPCVPMTHLNLEPGVRYDGGSGVAAQPVRLPSEPSKEAVAAAYIKATADIEFGGARGQNCVREMLRAAYAVDGVGAEAGESGGMDSVFTHADAPEGPWRAHKAAIEDWWEVERDGGAEYFGPRLFATKVEAIAVRDALNRVASQGEKPT